MDYWYEKSPHATCAIKIERNANVSNKQIASEGLFEVQDVASQLVVDPEDVAGQTWLDACAGAGGKTLHLASKGASVVAEDVRTVMLDELEQRAKRTGQLSQILDVKQADPDASADTLEGGYDGVLVDSPCDGSGTWRRQVRIYDNTAS